MIKPFAPFDFVHMPFDCRSTTQLFRRFMDQTFRGVGGVDVYFVDILNAGAHTHTHTNDHTNHLRALFGR